MGRYAKIYPSVAGYDSFAASYPECGCCENELLLNIGKGEYARICKKRLQCADFTPIKDVQANQ